MNSDWDERKEDEIERIKQEKKRLKEKLLFPDRCTDWQKHDCIMSLQPEPEEDGYYRFNSYESGLIKEFGKLCCKYEVQCITKKLIDIDLSLIFRWMWFKSNEIDSKYEREVVMEVIIDMLSKRDKNEVMLRILDKYHDAKESYEGSGKPWREVNTYLWMKECKERLSNAYGLTNDALEVYEAARKKRLKRLEVMRKKSILKEDRNFSLPQFCGDICNHEKEVEEIYKGRKAFGEFYALGTDLRSKYFDPLFCCRYKLRLFLKRFLTNSGIKDYVEDLILVKMILTYLPKQRRKYSRMAIKVLKEYDYNQVMECIGALYAETRQTLQKIEKGMDCTVSEGITNMDNLRELYRNKEKISFLKRLIHKLC